MRDMEITLTKNYMKVPEYARLYGLSENRVRQMCEAGVIDAYRDCEGGHWYIRDVPGEAVPREEYEKLLKENQMLRTKLQGIIALCNAGS